MKKAILIFLILLLNSFLSIGQSDSTQNKMNKKPILYFHGGIAFPLGDFGEASNGRDGYAQNGRSIGLGLIFPLQKGLSIDVGFSNKNFSVDKAAFDQRAETDIRGGLSGLITNDFQYSSEIGNYKNSNLLVGLKIDAFINEKVSFYFTPSLAVSWFKVANASITIKDGPIEITSGQSSPGTYAITYSLAVGTKVQLSDDFALNLNLDYLNSDQETEYTIITRDQNGNQDVQIEDYTDQFSAVTLSLGLQIRLK